MSNHEHEDRRTAAGISVSLSSQLISAALAMLAIEGAVVVFVVGERNPSPFFGFISLASFISFIASIIAAGLGITKDRNSGVLGKWNVEEASGNYNAQAISCLLGLILFVFSFWFIGKSPDQELRSEIIKLRQDLYQLSKDTTKKEQDLASSIELLKMSTSRLGDKIQTLAPLETEVPQLSTRIQDFVDQQNKVTTQLQDDLLILENMLLQIQQQIDSLPKSTVKP